MSHYTAIAVGKSRKKYNRDSAEDHLAPFSFLPGPHIHLPRWMVANSRQNVCWSGQVVSEKKINKNTQGSTIPGSHQTQIIPLQSPDQAEALWKWKQEQMGMYWTSTKLQSRDFFCQGFWLKLQYNSNYISSCRNTDTGCCFWASVISKSSS